MALKIGRSVSETRWSTAASVYEAVLCRALITCAAIDAQTDHGQVIIQGSLWLTGSLPSRMRKWWPPQIGSTRSSFIDGVLLDDR